LEKERQFNFFSSKSSLEDGLITPVGFLNKIKTIMTYYPNPAIIM